MQKADSEAVDATITEPRRGALGVRLVQRGQNLAAKVEPFGDLAHQVNGHDALRFDPKIRIAVALRDALTGDLEQVLEAPSDDQAQAWQRAFFGEQRVGCNGCPMRDANHATQRKAGALGDLAHALHEADGRVTGC